MTASPLLMTTGDTGRAQTRLAGQLTTAVGAVSTVVFVAIQGWTGLWSGLAATAVVLGFFVAGLTPLKLAGASGEKAGFGLLLLLMTYALRLAVAFLLLRALGRTNHLNADAVGFTIMFCAVAWTLGQAWVGLRKHDPLDIADYRQPESTDVTAS